MEVGVEVLLNEEDVGAIADAVPETVMVDRVTFGADRLQDKQRCPTIWECRSGVWKCHAIGLHRSPRILSIGNRVVIETEGHDESVIAEIT